MTETFTDLIGEVVGTYRCVERTDQRAACGSFLWLFRCTCEGCGRTRLFIPGEAHRYQRPGKTPRCYCAGYRAFIAARGVVHARRCGLCKSQTHSVADCPQRTPAKWCNDCAGLSHRVRGIKCRSCGLRFRAEPPVVLDVRGLGSSAGDIDKFALGGDTGDSTYRRTRKAKAA